MKKGIIRNIPLQADLCLNKQKVDIEDFKGWNKCNAPVYGNCLSPLYKFEEVHHDFFIGDDKYDWIDGVLYKNDVAVLSGVGSKKLKKTEVNQDYSALAVSEDDTLTWVKELSGTDIQYSLHGASVVTYTIENCNRIVKTKAFANDTYSAYGIAILYLRTDRAYGYYLAWNDNGANYTAYGESGQVPTKWEGFNVVSPLIQVGVLDDHKMLVSMFGTSGANISSTDVKNIYIQNGLVYDNPTFYDSTTYPTRYETKTSTATIFCLVKTKSASSGTYSGPQPSNYNIVNFGQRQEVYFEISAHKLPIEVTLASGDTNNPRDLETFRFEPSENAIRYYRNVYYWDYKDHTGEYSTAPKNRYRLQIITGNTTTTNIDRYGTGLVVPDSADFSTATGILHLPAYLRPAWEPNNTPPTINANLNFYGTIKYWTLDPNNANNKDAAPSYTTKETTFGGYNGTGMKVENMCYDGTVGGALADGTFWDNADASSYLSFNDDFNWVDKGGDTLPGGWNYNMIFGKKLWLSYQGVSGIPIEPTWYNANYWAAHNDPTRSCFNYGYQTRDKTISYQYKSQYTEQALKDVDCCMDDGKLYAVGSLGYGENTPLPTKLFALAGNFTSFDTTTKKISYTSTATFNIAYDQDDSTNIFPKYFKGMNLSIGNGYLRTTYLFKAKATDKQYINILIDSLSTTNPAHLYAGVHSGTGGNMQGGIKNTTNSEGFRLLYNNNLISNIACYEKKDYIGTILADWFTVDGEFCPAINSDTLYYKDNNNHLWKVEIVTTGNEWDYRIVENRYVVLNTTNYFNCYDTKTGLKRHWASDYNNRVMYGYEFTEYTNNSVFRSLLTSTLFSGLIITAQNANYEETKDTITGLELGAINYSRVILQCAFISCGVPYGAVEGIDLYRGDGNSTSAAYICSYQNKMKYIDNDLVNPYAVYPIAENGNVRYNPNLFTRFISSYNNKDMVISDGIAYKLVYFNNVIPIMAYYLLDGVEELKDAFVLQSSYYGVSETRLYQMNYSNGVGVEVVCDITNMEYLGALPTQALFWSAQNRAIYSFKGNCIMALSQYANDLTDIKNKWYNPATQELFLDTNIGLLVFSDLGTYCLDRFTVEIPPEQEGEDPTYEERDIKDIFFYPDKFIINLVDDTSASYYWSYNPLAEYESNNIHFITKYYGNGKTPITINNVYIRLYNQDVADAEGMIKFKGHTVTDIGVQTDEKTVNIGGEEGEEWDAETNTMLVKYTPQYNKGLGIALEVQTTFPIIDIRYDYVEDGAIEGQIAHINI